MKVKDLAKKLGGKFFPRYSYELSSKLKEDFDSIDYYAVENGLGWLWNGVIVIPHKTPLFLALGSPTFICAIVKKVKGRWVVLCDGLKGCDRWCDKAVGKLKGKIKNGKK